MTPPSDLVRKPKAPPKSKIASGIVARKEKPEGATAVMVRPLMAKGNRDNEEETFYVKLRAEADRGLIDMAKKVCADVVTGWEGSERCPCRKRG